MIIEKTLNGTCEKFFDVLIGAIILDVKISNGECITEKDISVGYTYDKVVYNKKNQLAIARIIKYIKPNEYCIEIESKSGITTINYKVEQADKNIIIVTYKEEYSTKYGKITNGFFYQRSIKKRMNTHFNQIQKYMNRTTIPK